MLDWSHVQHQKRITEIMGNMPDINKKLVGLRIRLELIKKLEIRAKRNRRTVTNELLSSLEEATRDIILTSEDYEWITREVKRNEAKRKRKNINSN